MDNNLRERRFQMKKLIALAVTVVAAMAASPRDLT